MSTPNRKINIAIIFGGRSGEHEVSLVSAASIIKTLNPKKYKITEIGITTEGRWLSGRNTLAAFKKGQTKSLAPVQLSVDPKKPGFFINGKFNKTEVCFPVLHGTYGEDGTIQGLFEMAGIPYVGCGVLSSSACMDKIMTKQIFTAHGLPQAKFMRVTKKQVAEEYSATEKSIIEEIGLPCFIKPANMGSSVGISKVKTIAQLRPALKDASIYDSSIIVETAIDAREIEVAVLGNDEPSASIAGEIVPSREFYDFYAKYVDNASKSFIPAEIPAAKMREVQELAVKAYKALQCSGMARVDFLMDKKTGELFLNEINTIPGFTSISMYPKLIEATGTSYPKLIDTLVALALERFAEKQKNKSTFDSGSDWYK